MSQIINSNIPSLQTQRNLERSQDQYQQALERLSSGLRINGSEDDPAGIAVSTRFQSQIQGLNQAVRNANDGISLAQTAEGGLGSMSESLQRIRELALQSANATNTAQDREALNQEVQQLKAEISRVSQDTDFNGTNLLDGSFAQTFFQIGASDGETIDVGLVGSTLDNMGSRPDDGVTSSATQQKMENGDLRINGVAIDAPAGRNDDTSFAEPDQSAIARAAAVNDQTRFTGVRAEANETSLAGLEVSDYDELPAGPVTLKLNGSEFTIQATDPADGGKVENALTRIAETINGEKADTGVEANFSGDPADGIQLVAEDGRNITLDFSSSANNSVQDGNTNSIAKDELAASLGLHATDGNSETFRGTYTLISEDGRDIQLDSDGDISRAGFQQGIFSGTNSGTTSEAVSANAMAEGDLILNGVSIRGSNGDDDTASPSGTNQASSAIAKAAAINAHSEETGVTASATPTVLTAGEVKGPADNGNDADSSFQVNGTTIQVQFDGNATVEERQQAIVGAVNARSGTTGVRAEAFTNSNDEPEFRLIAEDGRNLRISNFSDANYSATELGFSADADNGGGVGTGQIQRSSIALESAGSIQIETTNEPGDPGNPASAGFDIGTYGNDEESQLMRYVDISTTEGANDAIVAVDNALAQVNSQRAELGAIQNRFDSAISNQQTATNNLESANSRLVDADFAKESSELSRAQVLQQAGLSILSQANQQPQQVLQLLQG